MAVKNSNNTGLLLGAAVGGLLIGGSIFYASQRRARKVDNFQAIKNKLTDIAEYLASTKATAYDWSEKAKDFAEYVREETESLDPQQKQIIHLAIGSILGAFLAYGASKVCQSKDNKCAVLKDLGDKACYWTKNIKDVLDKINH